MAVQIQLNSMMQTETNNLAEVNGISVGHLYKTNPSKLIEQVKTVANNKEVSDFAI